jgi:hypothetical protein
MTFSPFRLVGRVLGASSAALLVLVLSAGPVSAFGGVGGHGGGGSFGHGGGGHGSFGHAGGGGGNFGHGGEFGRGDGFGHVGHGHFRGHGFDGFVVVPFGYGYYEPYPYYAPSPYDTYCDPSSPYYDPRWCLDYYNE